MKRITGFTWGLLLPLFSFCQQDTIVKTMDSVVMIAQRIKQQESSVPYDVKIIDQDFFLQFQPRTTPEALSGIGGVFVQKTNHGGGSPFLRGLTGNQVLTLIDGVRLNNSTFRYGPNQYLNTIDAYTINHVEVAKGTGSVQYGTDALGGVIHLITKDPQLKAGKSFTGNSVLKYMTANMEKTFRGNVTYSSEKWGVLAGTTVRDFGDLIGGDTTGKQFPSGYKEWSYDVKVKWSPQPNTEVIVANQLVTQSQVPVYHKVKLENFLINEMHLQQRMLSYARLQLKSNRSLWKECVIIASMQRSIEERHSQKAASDPLRREEDKVNTIGLTADVLSHLNQYWTANTGIESYHDDVASNREDINQQNSSVFSQRGLYPDNSRYSNYSVYSLHHIYYKKWVVDAGMRYNFFRVKIQDTSLGKVSLQPFALVGNAAIMYKLFPGQHLYVSYSSGFRAPNIDDMGTLGIVDFRYEIPNYSLQPEHSSNLEIGYKFNLKKWKGSLTTYYMRINDMIARTKKEGETINGYPVYEKENIEKAFIKGIEADFNYGFNKYWNLSGNLSYTYGQNLTRKEPLRRIPPLNGRWVAGWKKNKITTAVEVLFASKQNRLAQGDKDDNRIQQGGTRGWQVLNLYGGYRFSYLVVNFCIQNILDQDYRTHGSGINGAGRSAWLSITFKFI